MVEYITNQGKAYEKLGLIDQAKIRYATLLDYANQHLEDVIEFDYFAVSLPDTLIFEEDLQKKNKGHYLYLAGLGQLGLGNNKKAENHLIEAKKFKYQSSRSFQTFKDTF